MRLERCAGFSPSPVKGEETRGHPRHGGVQRGEAPLRFSSSPHEWGIKGVEGEIQGIAYG
jgi:hypothetical protein